MPILSNTKWITTNTFWESSEKIFSPRKGNLIFLLKYNAFFQWLWEAIFGESFLMLLFHANMANFQPPGYGNIAQIGISPFFLKTWYSLEGLHGILQTTSISRYWANAPDCSTLKEHPSFEQRHLPNWCNFPFDWRVPSFPNHRIFLSAKIIYPVLPHLQFYYAHSTCSALWTQYTLYDSCRSGFSGIRKSNHACLCSSDPRGEDRRAQAWCPTSGWAHAMPTGPAQTLAGDAARRIGELMMNGCESFVIAQAPLWHWTMEEDTSLAQGSNG